MILEALCFFYVLGFERKSPRTLKAKDNCLKFFFILEVFEMFWSLSFDLTSIFVVFSHSCSFSLCLCMAFSVFSCLCFSHFTFTFRMFLSVHLH